MSAQLAMAMPGWSGRPGSRLKQCLLLALLLHVWLVLVLGSAPAGSARPGEGVWGRIGGVLDVRLGGLRGQAAEPAAVAPPTGPVGPARQPRVGGAVRAAAPQTVPEPAEPGAARLGIWNSQSGEPLARSLPNRVTALPAAPAAAALPSLPNLTAPTPPAPAPAPAPTQTSAPEAPLPTPAPVPTPIIEPAPSVIEAPAARSEPLPTPTAARPEPEPLAPAPVQPAAPVQPLTPATTPATTPAAAPVSPPTASAPSPAAATQAPSATPTPTPTPTPYPAPAGAPDAGPRLGADVATPPSSPPGTPRAPLNLSLPSRGGALSARPGASGLLPLMPVPPERKSKLSEEMESAAKADCRKAYSSNGLLAAVPLILDAARDKGCRW